MRYDDTYFHGLGVRLDRLQPVEEAIELGLYRPEVAAGTDQKSTSVSAASGPKLAVEAGREALAAARARRPGKIVNIDLHLHINTYFQGLGHVVGPLLRPQPIGRARAQAVRRVLRLSNGGVAALEVAASIMNGRPDVETVLITAGDRFGEPACHIGE